MKKRKNTFKVEARVWQWPGDAPWHFVTLDKKNGDQIRNSYKKGMIKIRASLGKTTWDTALFPHKYSQGYLIALKKSVRLAEDVWDGDKVKISFLIK